MQLFPDRLFVAPHPIAGRPWWSKDTLLSRYTRIDGQIASTEEDAIEVDTKQPLKRPEFRVGQIWALPAYGSLRIYTISGMMALAPGQSTFYVTGPYIPPALSEGNLFEYFEHAFLVSDPLGGEAPWAPKAA
jgi:hypothetical protein